MTIHIPLRAVAFIVYTLALLGGAFGLSYAVFEWRDDDSVIEGRLDALEREAEAPVADTDNSIPVTLTEFIAQVKAGKVESIEVNGQEIIFRLFDDLDVTFKTEKEKGDILRRILTDAGIASEDFPPIKLKPPVEADEPVSP